MKLETERLELYVLTASQLKLMTEDLKSLEKELGFTYKGEPLEGEFLDITKNQIKVTEEDYENYMWHSFWLIVRKSDRIVVGSADFKNVPDENHQVEIGYGLSKEFEHHGYMTEAVRAMCTYALSNHRVDAVVAETLKDNLPSQRILKRLGFEKYKDEKTFWWRLSL